MVISTFSAFSINVLLVIDIRDLNGALLNATSLSHSLFILQQQLKDVFIVLFTTIFCGVSFYNTYLNSFSFFFFFFSGGITISSTFLDF